MYCATIYMCVWDYIYIYIYICNRVCIRSIYIYIVHDSSLLYVLFTIAT